MNDKELDTAFQKAVDSINEHTEPFPADVLLRLYAYYKRATSDDAEAFSCAASIAFSKSLSGF